MEFGLRSLGNRSILCDPRFSENINKINFKIKKGIFDAIHSTILKEDFKKFIINPKKLSSRFMSMAFDTTKKGEFAQGCNTPSRFYCATANVI